jgi:hypothetical protein
MDKRRLIFGSALLLIAIGLLLAAVTPGGWFNRDIASASIQLGSVSIQGFEERKSSPWPTTGYVLMGVGGLGMVVAYAMKPSRGA